MAAEVDVVVVADETMAVNAVGGRVLSSLFRPLFLLLLLLRLLLLRVQHESEGRPAAGGGGGGGRASASGPLLASPPLPAACLLH